MKLKIWPKHEDGYKKKEENKQTKQNKEQSFKKIALVGAPG